MVVVPTALGMRELAALEQNLTELAEHRVVLVPTMVPPVPPKRLVDRLAALAHRPVRGRTPGVRAPLAAQASAPIGAGAPTHPGERVRVAAAEYRAVADAVKEAIDG